MSDEGGDEAGEVEVVINREDKFKGFWANAYAEFGYANTTMDFMFALEGVVQGAAEFSMSGAGLQVEVCLGAIGMTVDAGKSFEFDTVSCRFKAVDVEADCNAAEAKMAAVEQSITAMETKLNDLNGTVDFLENGGFWMNDMLALARM